MTHENRAAILPRMMCGDRTSRDYLTAIHIRSHGDVYHQARTTPQQQSAAPALLSAENFKRNAVRRDNSHLPLLHSPGIRWRRVAFFTPRGSLSQHLFGFDCRATALQLRCGYKIEYGRFFFGMHDDSYGVWLGSIFLLWMCVCTCVCVCGLLCSNGGWITTISFGCYSRRSIRKKMEMI